MIFPPEPSKECVKVCHVIFECRVINHHPHASYLPMSLSNLRKTLLICDIGYLQTVRSRQIQGYILMLDLRDLVMVKGCGYDTRRATSMKKCYYYYLNLYYCTFTQNYCVTPRINQQSRNISDTTQPTKAHSAI